VRIKARLHVKVGNSAFVRKLVPAESLENAASPSACLQVEFILMTKLPEPTSKATAPHYVWGVDCDGWRLVDGNDLSVIHERMPAGRREMRHRHGRARQFFFVLTGALTLEVESKRHVLEAGHGLEIAPGSAHQAINDGPDPVEFLVISQPTTRGDREPAPA